MIITPVADKLAALQRRLKQVEVEIKDNDQVVHDMNKRRSDLNTEATVLQGQIKALAPPPPYVVTDHAVVRFLERELGVDVQGIREQMQADLGKVSTQGLVKYKGYIVKNSTIVSYLPQDYGSNP